MMKNGLVNGVLPTGVVTLLLTDLEGSTPMWDASAAVAAVAVARHRELLYESIETYGGVRPEEQGEGDSVVAAFTNPSDALATVFDVQRAFASEPWPTRVPLRVRMALHTGEVSVRDDRNYQGPMIIRARAAAGLGARRPGPVLRVAARPRGRPASRRGDAARHGDASAQGSGPPRARVATLSSRLGDRVPAVALTRRDRAQHPAAPDRARRPRVRRRDRAGRGRGSSARDADRRGWLRQEPARLAGGDRSRARRDPLRVVGGARARLRRQSGHEGDRRRDRRPRIARRTIAGDLGARATRPRCAAAARQL